MKALLELLARELRPHLLALGTLAVSSAGFFLSANVAERAAWASGRTDILLVYSCSYYVALVAAAAGIALSLSALQDSTKDDLPGFVHARTFIASFAYVLYLFMAPHLEGRYIF